MKEKLLNFKQYIEGSMQQFRQHKQETKSSNSMQANQHRVRQPPSQRLASIPKTCRSKHGKSNEKSSQASSVIKHQKIQKGQGKFIHVYYR